MSETEVPFDGKQRLLAMGIRQHDLSQIAEQTLSERVLRESMDKRERGSIYREPDFLASSYGLLSGNYQERMQDELGYPRPTLVIEKPKSPKPSARQRFWKYMTENPSEPKESPYQEKEIHAVSDVAQKFAAYLREVVEKGERPATYVDFGAGSAVTALHVAHLLKDTNHTRVIATNIDAAPTDQDLTRIQYRFAPEHAANFLEAMREKTAIITNADIVELYESLQNNPVHLFSMFGVLPFTENHNATLLKIVGEMLHPRFGTAILSYHAEHGLPESNEIVKHGLNALVEKGFRRVDPLQFDQGRLHYPGRYEFPIQVYQAPEAPPLQLYTVD